MPKYRVYLQTVASTTIEVEAEDKHEAYELATEQDDADRLRVLLRLWRSPEP